MAQANIVGTIRDINGLSVKNATVEFTLLNIGITSDGLTIPTGPITTFTDDSGYFTITVFSNGQDTAFAEYKVEIIQDGKIVDNHIVFVPELRTEYNLSELIDYEQAIRTMPEAIFSTKEYVDSVGQAKLSESKTYTDDKLATERTSIDSSIATKVDKTSIYTFSAICAEFNLSQNNFIRFPLTSAYSAYDNTNHAFVAPKDGIYIFTGKARVKDGDLSTADRQIGLGIGTAISDNFFFHWTFASYRVGRNTLLTSRTMTLSQGDIVYFYAYSDGSPTVFVSASLDIVAI